MKKLISLFIAVIFVVLALCSCSKASSAEHYYDANGEASEKTEDLSPSDNNGTVIKDDTVSVSEIKQKLIKKYNVSLETLEYDKAKTEISELVAANGGYFSSSSENNGSIRYNGKSTRNGSYVIRIPSEKLDAFIEALGKKGNVLSSNLTTSDVTESYYNLRSRLDALVLQQQRILEMMENAKELKYLIQLEDKLAELRSEINEINYKLQYYDKSVDYSYVNLSLYEVVEYQEAKEPTFLSRLGKAISGTFVTFGKVVGEVFIAFIWVFPFILLGGIIAVIVIVLTNKDKKKKLAKTQNNPENK